MKTKILFYLAAIYTICIYGPMAAMSIGAGTVAVLFFIIDRDYKKLISIFRSPLGIATIFLSLACVWSLVWAKVSGLEFYGMKPNIQWGKDTAKLWHLFFPFLLAIVFQKLSHTQLRKIGFLWLGLGGVSAVFGVLQHYFPIYNALDLPNEGLRGYYHSTGMTGFHLSFASIIAFPAMACFAAFSVLYRREKFSERTLLALVGIVFFLLTSFFTYSKIMWVAIPITFMVLVFIGLKGRIRYILAASLLAVSLLLSLSSEVRYRFSASEPIRERMEIWSANIAMVKQFPLFGVGWHHNSELSEPYYKAHARDGHGFQSHAHNNWMDQLATTGILGLVAFLIWSVLMVRMSYLIYKTQHDLLWRSLGLGFLGGWICLHINGLTQTNFWDAKVMHQMGWVTALSLELYRRYVRADFSLKSSK